MPNFHPGKTNRKGEILKLKYQNILCWEIGCFAIFFCLYSKFKYWNHLQWKIGISTRHRPRAKFWDLIFGIRIMLEAGSFSIQSFGKTESFWDLSSNILVYRNLGFIWGISQKCQSFDHIEVSVKMLLATTHEWRRYPSPATTRSLMNFKRFLMNENKKQLKEIWKPKISLPFQMWKHEENRYLLVSWLGKASKTRFTEIVRKFLLLLKIGLKTVFFGQKMLFLAENLSNFVRYGGRGGTPPFR